MSIGIGYDANLRFDFACGGHLPPSYGVTLFRIAGLGNLLGCWL
jgi:hypothetical protein